MQRIEEGLANVNHCLYLLLTHLHTCPSHQAACMILRIDDIVSGMKKKK